MIAAICLFQEIERCLAVPQKAIQAIEFQTFAELDFSLHVPAALVVPHVGRIISSWECSNLQEYLGKKSYELFMQS